MTIEQLEETTEPIFIREGTLFITDPKVKAKFLKEVEKLRSHCSKKVQLLENILNDKIKVNVNLNFSSQEEMNNGDL